MRVLVTGGAGFIGSEFVRLTLREHPGDEVLVLDKLTYSGNLANLDGIRDDVRLDFERGDICDEQVVDRVIGACDAVVNFAAETHVDRSLESPGQFIRTDVYGTWVLLEAARRHGVTRFLHVSTDEVYGDVPEGRSVETDPLRPRSPYSASKAGGEMMVAAYRESFGFRALVTRGSNTYGHHQYPEKIIPLFITNAIDGIEVPVYGDGSAVRDYLHVDDHARGIDTVLRSGTPGEAYNLGAGTEIDGNAVAAAVLAALQRPASLATHVRDRLGHDRRYALDTGKARALGWSPRVAFDDGIRETAAWYAEHEDWWRPLKSGEFWDFYRRNYQPLALASE